MYTKTQDSIESSSSSMDIDNDDNESSSDIENSNEESSSDNDTSSSNNNSSDNDDNSSHNPIENPDITNIINNFERISFFGNHDKFMELYINSKLQIQNFEFQEEVEQILDKTFERYKIYINKIGYMNIQIRKDLDNFLKKFKDYENTDDIQLFKYMNYIDNIILDKIISSGNINHWL